MLSIAQDRGNFPLTFFHFPLFNFYASLFSFALIYAFAYSGIQGNTSCSGNAALFQPPASPPLIHILSIIYIYSIIWYYVVAAACVYIFFAAFVFASNWLHITKSNGSCRSLCTCHLLPLIFVQIFLPHARSGWCIPSSCILNHYYYGSTSYFCANGNTFSSCLHLWQKCGDGLSSPRAPCCTFEFLIYMALAGVAAVVLNSTFVASFVLISIVFPLLFFILFLMIHMHVCSI